MDIHSTPLLAGTIDVVGIIHQDRGVSTAGLDDDSIYTVATSSAATIGRHQFSEAVGSSLAEDQLAIAVAVTAGVRPELTLHGFLFADDLVFKLDLGIGPFVQNEGADLRFPAGLTVGGLHGSFSHLVAVIIGLSDAADIDAIIPALFDRVMIDADLFAAHFHLKHPLALEAMGMPSLAAAAMDAAVALLVQMATDLGRDLVEDLRQKWLPMIALARIERVVARTAVAGLATGAPGEGADREDGHEDHHHPVVEVFVEGDDDSADASHPGAGFFIVNHGNLVPLLVLCFSHTNFLKKQQIATVKRAQSTFKTSKYKERLHLLLYHII